MRYRLHTPPVVDTTKVNDELARLLLHARRLTITSIVVNPPFKTSSMAAIAIEVPDAMGPMAKRVFEVIQGPVGRFTEIREPLPVREEWTHCAFLLPQRTAEALDTTTIADWSSAGLQLSWSKQCINGVLWHTAQDAERVQALRARGWRVVSMPRRYAATLSTMLRLRYTHVPQLIWLDNQQASRTITQDSERIAAALNAAATSTTSPPVSSPVAVPTALATSGDTGLYLGTTPEGQPVALTMHALTLGLDMPDDSQRTVIETMAHRAISCGMGVVAILPQALYRRRMWKPLQARLRVLDGRDLSESAAIPWQQVAPEHLQMALAQAGITAAVPTTLPDTFGALLSMLPNGKALCRADILGLTANPGDELRDVVNVGGAVALVTDPASPSDLLGHLLLAAVCAPSAPNRPVLLIRPSTMTPPLELASIAIQITLGLDGTALTTMRVTPDGWEMVHADGAPATKLDPDLHRAPATVGAGDYDVLLNALNPHDDAKISAIHDKQDEIFPALATPLQPFAVVDTSNEVPSEDPLFDVFSIDLDAGLPDADAGRETTELDADLSDVDADPETTLRVAVQPEQEDFDNSSVSSEPPITPMVYTRSEDEQPAMVDATPDLDTISDLSERVHPQSPDTADESPDWLSRLWVPAPFPDAQQPETSLDNTSAFAATSDFPGLSNAATPPFPAISTSPRDADSLFPTLSTSSIDTDDSLFPARDVAPVDEPVEMLFPDLVTTGPATSYDLLFADAEPALFVPVVEDLELFADAEPVLFVPVVDGDSHNHTSDLFEPTEEQSASTQPEEVTQASQASTPDMSEPEATNVLFNLAQRGPAGYRQARLKWQRKQRRAEIPQVSDVVVPELFDEDDRPDYVTQALVDGDLNFAEVPLFEGPEFTLAPLDGSLADEVSPMGDEEQPDTTALEPSIPVLVSIVPDESALTDYPQTTAETLPSQWVHTPDLSSSAAPETPAAHVFVPEPAEEIIEIPLPLASIPADASLRFDAELLKQMWTAGTTMAQLVELVCRANPGSQPHIVRRAIRPVIASAPPPPFIPTAPSTRSQEKQPAPAPYQPNDEPSATATQPEYHELKPFAEESTADGTRWFIDVQRPANASSTQQAVLNIAQQQAVDDTTLVDQDSPASTSSPFMETIAPAEIAYDMAPPIYDDDILRDWQQGISRADIQSNLCLRQADLSLEEATQRIDRAIAPYLVTTLAAEGMIKRLERGRGPMPSQQDIYTNLLTQFAGLDAPLWENNALQQRLLQALATSPVAEEVV